MCELAEQKQSRNTSLVKKVGLFLNQIRNGPFDSWIVSHDCGVLRYSLHLLDEGRVGVFWWDQCLYSRVNLTFLTSAKIGIYPSMSDQLNQR